MCQKRKYSKMGALFALASAQDKNNEYRPTRVYKCNLCAYYHLTSQVKNGYNFHG